MTVAHARGYWGMFCWNGLSAEQQDRLIKVGNLPFGFKPEGDCPNGAELEITTMYDEAPGPRFYCRACGAEYLAELQGADPGQLISPDHR
jgi:hypothetical protein